MVNDLSHQLVTLPFAKLPTQITAVLLSCPKYARLKLNKNKCYNCFKDFNLNNVHRYNNIIILIYYSLKQY